MAKVEANELALVELLVPVDCPCGEIPDKAKSGRLNRSTSSSGLSPVAASCLATTADWVLKPAASNGNAGSSMLADAVAEQTKTHAKAQPHTGNWLQILLALCFDAVTD